VTVTNQLINYGWEYVWHCHILGHEENDFMRAVGFAVPPAAASNLVVTGPTATPLRATLTWNDNANNTSGFTLVRATDPAFTLNVVKTAVAKKAGVPQSYIDTTVVANTTYYYEVIASNVIGGVAPGYPSLSANATPSNVVTIGPPAAAPSNVVASQPGTKVSDPVVVTWTDNSPNVPNPPNFDSELRFTVQRATSLTGTWTTLTTAVPAAPGAGTTVTYQDTKAKTKTTFYYRIIATNLFGSSTPPAVSNAITTR